MGTTLSTLKPPRGATRNRKRVGRGPGSGTGEQSGRGVKGQKARSGHHGARLGFEGGQMPMQRRFPKKGFKNFFRKEFFGVNVAALEAVLQDRNEGVVDIALLKSKGIVPRRATAVKILGEGTVTKKLSVKASAFSTSAREKIEKAGGTVEVVAAAG